MIYIVAHDPATRAAKKKQPQPQRNKQQQKTQQTIERQGLNTIQSMWKVATVKNVQCYKELRAMAPSEQSIVSNKVESGGPWYLVTCETRLLKCK